jgi:hypothetical protein
MVVMITPSENGFLVEKQMMVNGELHAIACYDGGDEDYAREVFENITRDDVATTQQEMLNGEVLNPEVPDEVPSEEVVPETEEETEEETPMSDEEVQEAYDGLNKKQLGSWTHCMQDKIVDHYGKAVKTCTDGITHGNFVKILECIVIELGIADPEVWIPEQLGLFTIWSTECIFGSELKED